MEIAIEDIELKFCRVCHSKKLKEILNLGNQYLSDFVVGKTKPKKFPLVLIACRLCKLIQLKHTVPQSLLYTERYGYKSGVNNTMQNELREIAEKAKGKIKKKKLTVLDIGANDGTLLSNYGKDIFKIGIEPIVKFANECQKHADVVVNDFFNFKSYKKILKDRKSDIITVISCFYDMEDPNQFIKDVKKILEEDGIIIIQQNYLVSMLLQNAFDNIVHEHLEYYSLNSLNNLLSRHGLEVFDVELSDVNGGSFRTYICNSGKRKASKRVLALERKEKKLGLDSDKAYLEFTKRVKENRIKMRKVMESLRRNNKKVYIYGASTRGNTLLQYMGLDKKHVSAAVERNPEKWGRNFASVGIPIISEEQARKEKPDYMLILPWFFKKEFLEREKDFLERGGHFIFPLPNVEII